MIIFSKIKKFPVIFTTVSLMALFIFIVSLIFFKNLILGGYAADNKKNEEIYYFKKDKQLSDPLFTQAPNLDDIIRGPIITEEDPYIGPMDAKINMVVYTDFTCWYCYQTLQSARKVQSEFPEKTRLIHKDFPVNNPDNISYQAAVAGRCAQEQNKFWQMGERLYQNYYQLDRKLFLSLAEQLQLNIREFKECLDERSTATLVDGNIKEGGALQIVGIPLIYVNSRQVMGEISHEELKNIVEKELNPNS